MAKATTKATTKKKATKKKAPKQSAMEKSTIALNNNMMKLMEQNAQQTNLLATMMIKQHKSSVSQRAKRSSIHLLKAGAAILNVD